CAREVSVVTYYAMDCW
nr:immunoglobulin heavy chain junction region [Mus musculus]